MNEYQGRQIYEFYEIGVHLEITGPVSMCPAETSSPTDRATVARLKSDEFSAGTHSPLSRDSYDRSQIFESVTTKVVHLWEPD